MNKKEQDLRTELARIDKTISSLKTSQEDKRQEIADYLCPFKVKDCIIKSTAPFNVIIIENIAYSGLSESYKLIGFKIKKDGKPYKYSTEIWQPNEYIKYEGYKNV